MTTFKRACPKGSLSLALMGALCWIAVTATPAAGQAGPGDLSLSLDIGKSEVLVGEPIYATLTLANRGNGPVPVFPDLYPEVEVGAIEIRRGDAAELFRPTAVDDVETQVQDLPAGQSVAATFPIFFGAQGWVFTEAGTYVLTGLYTHPTAGPDGQLRSPAVTLKVADGGPAGALLTDGKAGSRDAGLFMHWEGGDHLRRGIALLETLIESYPKALQTNYARLSLGLSLSRSFRDYSIGKVRKPDYERARRFLAPIDDARLQPVTGLRKALGDARIAFALNDRGQAQKAAERARAIVQERPALSGQIDEAIQVAPDLEPLLKR